MPLPQNVIEQLSREPQQTPGWSGRIVMFSGTIFFLSVVIYIGVAFGYTAYLNSRLNNLQQQVNTFSSQVPAEDQQRIVSFYSQISNLRTALAGHVVSSPFFTWLEQHTETNITFSLLTLDTANNQAVLGGTAKTMDDLNAQLAIFKAAPEITKVTIGTTNFATNAWQFSLTLGFAPGYFTPARAVATPSQSNTPSSTTP